MEELLTDRVLFLRDAYITVQAWIRTTIPSVKGGELTASDQKRMTKCFTFPCDVL